mmetsp:Transcript_22425/g.48724  ORF Transcript_22425/g.48724 Transcript_22425/m.48724 type:complete len:107 (-) Transcript_22425:91-411(-)
MKISALIAALASSSAAAFSPAPAFGVSNAMTSTQTFMRNPDPEFLMHLAQHAEDSTRIVIQQCDGQECREIYGVRDHLGWTFDGGLAGDWKQTTLRVVSRYGEDCE